MTASSDTNRLNFHRAQIRRYGRLLATDLTEVERKYIQDRIAENYSAIDQLLDVKNLEAA